MIVPDLVKAIEEGKRKHTMNEQIKELVRQAGGIGHDDDGNELTPILVGTSLEKFAELLKTAIYNNVKEWLTPDEHIAEESDPMVQEYLKGYNSGNVDALCEIKNFGVDLEP